MIFALVTTTQLMAVIVGIVTMNAIWFNPDPCPDEYLKLGQQELREVCELQYYGYSQWRWVVKE